jgi:hypothetical protein
MLDDILLPDGRVVPMHTAPGLPLAAWGPLKWRWLHVWAIFYPSAPTQRDARRASLQLARFLESLPCASCMQHARAFVAASPPPLDSSASLQEWTRKFHNTVNARLSRPEFTRASFALLYERERALARRAARSK